jgi:large subunit ribosomal protein L9|tara:strand:+ start:190 stop:648 length:459 start_codon:yes stop_codon:yes gene_type:complete
MEVVLLENIKNLGQIGDVVNVKRGHGRNFLIKYNKALKASKENINLVNTKKTELNQKNLELKKSSKKILDIINQTQYKFFKRAKENGELYGSLKPVELSNSIEELHKIKIKPSQIDLASEIKKIGSYSANINLHAEIQAKILIEVVKEEDEN